MSQRTIRQCKSCVGRPGIAGGVQAPEPPHQSPRVEEAVPQTALQEETKDDADVGTEGRTLADRGERTERTDGVQDFVRASTLASNRAVRDSQICVFPQTVCSWGSQPNVSALVCVGVSTSRDLYVSSPPFICLPALVAVSASCLPLSLFTCLTELVAVFAFHLSRCLSFVSFCLQLFWLTSVVWLLVSMIP